MAPNPSTATAVPFVIRKARTRFFGLTWDECIQAFFGGNAFVAVLVLALITVFLFREGIDFFSLNRRQNLQAYRMAGLEYVDIARAQEREHTSLVRELSQLRLKSLQALRKEGRSLAEANAALAPFDAFATQFSDAADGLRGKVSEWTEYVSALKTRYGVSEEARAHRAELLEQGKTAEAATIKVEEIQFAAELKPIRDDLAGYREVNQQLAGQINPLLAALPALPTPELQRGLERFAKEARAYVASFPKTEKKLEAWDPNKPIPFHATLTSFLFGREWLTASFWQDWYGIVPLFVGSLMVSVVALFIAVPLGVGAALYVNQIARPTEQRVIKPAIEFISAFPSVVLGFFGIAVLGELLRQASQVPWLSGLPGFPIAERLNVLTAGCLLALIAVPTIFTLAEDALNNVPRSFKEASFALGASRLQTLVKVTIPASLSGIISAVLLGLGRVIGETMVVLLCAGNRIAIPDFSAGLGAFTQPVHTMTGIIAQEMGEVVRGSIHYRALFMVGIVLFFLSLSINYAAQKLVGRYRISIG